jgi:hypothetical protein
MLEHRLETDPSMATGILCGSPTPVAVVEPGDSVVVRSFDASRKSGDTWAVSGRHACQPFRRPAGR